MKEGIVVKNMNGYFYVQDQEGGLHECKVRGRLKQKRYSLLVGDKVVYGEDGFVESILPRYSELYRPAVANINQVILVVAAHMPDINTLLLDRLCVSIEDKDLPFLICINKYDLADERTKEVEVIYKQAGYEVLYTSTYTGQGLSELKERLKHKITAFAGPSGVGKSSLLNAVEPAFNFQTGQVSDKIKRGRHTTRHASLYALGADSFIMDTPGFSSLDMSHISLERLPTLFPEILAREGHCKYNPCYHDKEPVCAIKEAVASGAIHPSRYANYLQLRQEIQEQIKKRY
ncbi:MAG: ribosome small subunit-dependent GTPase A [Veillonellaceae bacterium]|nr:ribosome small subunit-dependent GTPase A [Veillonellaceae bacterium]